MSEPKWTQGPWKVVDRSAYHMNAHDPKWEIDQESGQEPFWVALAINKANADLIAAAPYLYAAAALACLMFERKNHSTADSDWMGDDEYEAWTALRKAMEKARGEA